METPDLNKAEAEGEEGEEEAEEVGAPVVDRGEVRVTVGTLQGRQTQPRPRILRVELRGAKEIKIRRNLKITRKSVIKRNRRMEMEMEMKSPQER